MKIIMSKKFILKLNNKEHSMKFNALPSNKYYKILTLILRSIVGLQILLSVLFLTLISTLNIGSRDILIVPVFSFVILMITLTFVKLLLNPIKLLKIFSLDTALMLFVSILTLISLIPFLSNIFGVNLEINNSLINNQGLNINLFSSLSLIIHLFFSYYLITSLRSIKKKKFIFSLIPALLLGTIIFRASSFDQSLLLASTIGASNLSIALLEKFKKPIINTLAPILLILNTIIAYYIGISNNISDFHMLLTFSMLLPLLSFLLLSSKSVLSKFNITFVLSIFLISLIQSEWLKSIIIQFAFSILIIFGILISIKKDKIISWLSETKNKFSNSNSITLNVPDLFSIVGILIIVSVILLLSYDIIFNGANQLSLITWPLKDDIQLLLDPQSGFLSWLIGQNSESIFKTQIGELFGLYGMVGVWGFIGLISYITLRIYRAIRPLPAKTATLGLSIIFSLISLLVFSFIGIWNDITYLIFWVVICYCSIFLDKLSKEPIKDYEVNNVVKIKTKSTLLFSLLEGLRIILIIGVIYIGRLILIKSGVYI